MLHGIELYLYLQQFTWLHFMNQFLLLIHNFQLKIRDYLTISLTKLCEKLTEFDLTRIFFYRFVHLCYSLLLPL